MLYVGSIYAAPRHGGTQAQSWTERLRILLLLMLLCVARGQTWRQSKNLEFSKCYLQKDIFTFGRTNGVQCVCMTFNLPLFFPEIHNHLLNLKSGLSFKKR